jgi:hypothetical protein
VESLRAPRPNERPAERVHARVLGSGSLFRLDREERTHFNGSGTRLRLYLEDRKRPLSEYRDAILKWLWLPEFRTSLAVEGEEPKHLEAGQPTDQFKKKMGPLIPMTGSEDSTRTPRAFWCLSIASDDYHTSLKAAVLADGILTTTYNRSDVGGLLREGIPLGTAVNLTEKLRPELSVDRREILSLANASHFVWHCIDAGGWEGLGTWDAPSLDVLVRLFDSCPVAMFKLSHALRIRAVLMPDIVQTITATEPKLPSASGVCDVDTISGIPSFFTCERGVNRGMRAQVRLNRDSDVEQYGWRTAPRFFTVSRCPDLSGQCSG